MKETDFTTYYDRTMDDSFISKVLGDYPWLIKFVKKTPELDFQTGHDPRQGRSWFSVYKGTGRVITFVSRRNGYKIDAADAYKRIAPIVFFEHPTENSFVEYLSNIREAPNLQRYYESDQGKKEGFYQNLIGRRYTFNTKAEDDFIIIDKEMVVGFKDEVTKTAWNKDIISNIEALIRNLRRDYKGRLPKDISSKYGEFDFLAMTWDGDIIIIDIPSRSISVKLSDEELAARPQQPLKRNRMVSKALRAYAQSVSSADKGGVRIID